MLTLTNLSNADCDVEHILHGDTETLPAILQLVNAIAGGIPRGLQIISDS